ncbi:MAG: tetratricopeptide repeat protein [Treponema sp.]|nr:tetratricopeptide repeat protein [Treponema sp.]MCL2250305.1 tetratricopeptide repeat protein [Treponema sp.]
MKILTKKLLIFLSFILICLFFTNVICSCAGMAASAEEYYSIGMAYFELGKFDEAEKWLNRARQADKTYVASQYNLGRLAFEQNRFEEAIKHFEGILKRDPDNVLALRACAYTRIKMGNIEIARKHYARLLLLVPESADDGYNHALVLFAMEMYGEAEEVLAKYPFAMHENKDIQLLFARSQGKQNKVEAIESFSNWLSINTSHKARYEYALVLEFHEMYARAIEEFRQALKETTSDSNDPKQNEIQFALAKVLLIADSDSNEGIIEMQKAVDQGFKNISALEELIRNPLISNVYTPVLQNIIDNLNKTQASQNQTTEQNNANEIENIEYNLETYPESGT